MNNIDGLHYEPRNYPRYGEAPYVGLGQLLAKIERAMECSYGNGVASCEVDLPGRTVEFVVERTAYQANSFHCGTETYTASLPIRKLGRNWVVFPEEMDCEWKAAQPERTYTRDEAIEFLDERFDGKWPREGETWQERLSTNPTDDDIISLAHEQGLSDGDYVQPDDEFAWQHLYHGFLEPMIEEIKAEHEKLRADAVLRRAGVRTDLTKKQLASIEKCCIDALASDLDNAELATAAVERYSVDCRLGIIRQGLDIEEFVGDLGFNPWTEAGYERLLGAQSKGESMTELVDALEDVAEVEAMKTFHFSLSITGTLEARTEEEARGTYMDRKREWIEKVLATDDWSAEMHNVGERQHE